MPADGPPPRGSSRWQCLRPTGDGGVRITVVGSTRYPDLTRVELSPDDAARQIGDDAIVEIELGPDGEVLLLRVMPAYAAKAPAVWFAELRENNARPPAVNLLAFTGAGQPANTLVDETALTNIPVSSADQLGAFRWYPATGEVDQVYVQPRWRRQSIGTMLAIAAGMLSAARDWPRLWGDGQRTELGETWRNRSFWRDAAQPLTHTAPPMTPQQR